MKVIIMKVNVLFRYLLGVKERIIWFMVLVVLGKFG